MTEPREPGAELEFVDRDTGRYRGPEGEVDVRAWLASERGLPLERGGVRVRAYEADSMRWASPPDRAGRAVPDAVRDAVLDRIRAGHRGRGVPYDLVFASGRIEDETGAVRDGFRSALPRVEHSAGWRLTELWLSREHPDPDDYPPTVTYADGRGEVEIPRRIVRDEDGRTRVVVEVSAMHRVGDAAGRPIEPAEREAIVERLRLVYDTWGPLPEFR